MRNLLLILVLLFASCDSEKKLAKQCAKCPKKDSIVIKETIKVTPFDTALFISQTGKDILFPDVENGNCCEMVDTLYAMMTRGNGTITAENNGIKSSIFKKDKNIVFRCEADSLKKIIEGLRTVIEKTSSKVQTITIEEKCDKSHKDWLDKYDRPWFWISLFLLLLFLGIKFGPKLLGIFRKLPL